jgi:hypothetical protein
MHDLLLIFETCHGLFLFSKLLAVTRWFSLISKLLISCGISH